jgi:DNA-binding XRE family transcriptional regulator
VDPKKRKRLEDAGYAVFDHPAEFLKLDEADRKMIDLRVAVCRNLKNLRKRHGLTQIDAAKILKTSQSCYSRMESGAGNVTLDLIISSIFKLRCRHSAVPIKVKTAKKAPKSETV